MRLIALFFSLLICTLGSCSSADEDPNSTPKGYVVPRNTFSPDHRYGVSVPILGQIQDPGVKNNLIELKTERTLGALNSTFTGWSKQNRGGVLPSRWSPDSKLLLWEVEGRWSPDALTLVHIKNGNVDWQLNLLELAQKALLARTQEAAPKKYAAAKERNKGDGSAFPDGFVVNVRAEGDKPRGGSENPDVTGKTFSLPLKIHAELTSNPKQLNFWPKEAQLDSELDGIIDTQGKFSVSHFSLRDKPIGYATSDSFLELTDPSSAATVPREYGDDVALTGQVKLQKDKSGKPIYVLNLDKTISISASDVYAVDENISQVELLGFDKFGQFTPGTLPKSGVFEVFGCLRHSTNLDQPMVTLSVSGYGFSR